MVRITLEGIYIATKNLLSLTQYIVCVSDFIQTIHVCRYYNVSIGL